jgi:Kef-type K+ transport system membrane component KefB
MEFSQLLTTLVVVWVSAKALGQLAHRLGQPSVVGELLAGVLVGPYVLGWVPQHEFLHALSQLAVLLLLFEVGLETDLGEMLRVGWKAAGVALAGMLIPLAGGYALGAAYGLAPAGALLLGAALSATSIAITTRALTELGEADSQEGRIVLGAAVLDDVLGLALLGVVSQLTDGGAVSSGAVARVVGEALLFLVGAIVLGRALAKPLVAVLDRMTVRGVLVTGSLALAMGLAALAHRAGTAAIVGAFAAGLALAATRRADQIREELRPVADVFTPVFFVGIGAALDPRVLSPTSAEGRAGLVLAALALLVAFGGKMLSGLAAWGKGVRRGLVGASMAPRGEVVLIFAGIGREAGLLGDAGFAALVIVVLVTAAATPSLMAWLARRSSPPVKRDECMVEQRPG